MPYNVIYRMWFDDTKKPITQRFHDALNYISNAYGIPVEVYVSEKDFIDLNDNGAIQISSKQTVQKDTFFFVYEDRKVGYE